MSSIDLMSPEGSSMKTSSISSQSFYRFCDKYRIQNVDSTAYNLTANGLAEAFKLLKKFISASKQDWNKKLSKCV